MKKFKLDRKCVFFSIISLMIVSLFAFGSASWTMAITKDFGTGTINKVDLDEGRVVAYINENTEANQYRSVELALAKAKDLGGGEVYVIPGTNPTIKVDCEVASGVSLILPYSDKTYKIDDYSNYEGDKINAVVGTTFSDSSQTSVDKYRKNNLTIKAGKKLTNNGNLYVGGVVGANTSQRPTGQTIKEYCQITLEDDASIETNGRLEIYGYIKNTSAKGTGAIYAKSGYVGFPMVIYDFRGGTYTSTIYRKKVFPFSIFDFPNVQSDLIISYDSSINIWAKFASRKSLLNDTLAVHEANDFYVYSSNSKINSLFKMEDQNSTITLRYVSPHWSEKESYTMSDSAVGTTRVSFTGSVKLHYFEASVDLGTGVAATVKSSDYDLPLSYKFDVTINTGTFTIANRVKFMTGSSLIINKGAKLISNSDVAFYTSYTDQSGVAKVYPDGLEAAKCIVNGTMDVNGNFGGNVLTEATGAKVLTGSSFSNSIGMNEMSGDNSINHNETAKGFISYNASSIKERALIKGTTFNSNLGEVNYWSASVAESSIDAQLTADTTETNKVGTIMNFTLYLLPSEDFFDMQKGVTWSFKKKTTSWGQTKWVDTTDQTFKNDVLNASLTITSKPDNGLFGSKQTDTYRVYCEVYKNDGTLVSKYVEISVSSK